MATKFNNLTEAEKQLKAQLGELEQEFARLPSANSQARESLGGVVIKSEALKQFAASVEGNKRVSIPVSAALSTDIPAGIVEPQRLPGIDAAPKQRLFIRDLIAPGRTTAPAIFWVQQTGFTNAAKVVAEGTTKPYSNIEFASKLTAADHCAYVQGIQADPGRLRSWVRPSTSRCATASSTLRSKRSCSVTAPACTCTVSSLKPRNMYRPSKSKSVRASMICAWQCCRLSWRACQRLATSCTSWTGQRSS